MAATQLWPLPGWPIPSWPPVLSKSLPATLTFSRVQAKSHQLARTSTICTSPLPAVIKDAQGRFQDFVLHSTIHPRFTASRKGSHLSSLT
ncbi:hypothetical protein DFH07DRAFT_44279 [Mycena maculata]|uniref:Uncharacterized protein n=1 Tax=Mycena maculata TaxID=230809 RepID=A0AAD7IG00_9AGAR|nr:hypothetical protein DFH07DRAFT_44279 [Mycena maculata]